MMRIIEWKRLLVLLVGYGWLTHGFTETIADPCGGPLALINIMDRPTYADSACVVPYKDVVIETGYQYQVLTHSAGHQQNYPEAEFRLGLPLNNEFYAILPNYNRQTTVPQSGYAATTLGIKHEIGYSQYWLGAIEAGVILPNGSTGFGNQGAGLVVNGIANYRLTSQLNFTFLLGISTDTLPSYFGGQRYTSVNPDIVASYSLTDRAALYGEVYGMSRTGPGQGSGFNSDAGVIYLVKPAIALDLGLGRRISGSLGSFSYYYSAGFSVML